MMKQLGIFLAYESSVSTLPATFIHAYAMTDFHIRLKHGSAVLNIGQQCTALDQYLLATGAETAVVFSAANPISESAEENLVCIGMTYEDAVQRAVEYDQSAFVWYVLSSRAKLVLME